ncbi:MAG: ABC transporter permease [Lachnospiraceae bacterium]
MDQKWEKYQSSAEEREKIWKKSRSFAGDVWYRFRHKPTAIAGLVIIAAVVLFAFLGPLFTGHSYSEQNLDNVNTPPLLSVFAAPDGDGYFYITENFKILRVDENGNLGGQLTKTGEEDDRYMMLFDYKGDEVALYYGEKPYKVIDPDTLVIFHSARLWNHTYLLGSDSLGRDILTRLMYGIRVSMLVALVAVAVNLVIGILFGGISGYFGGVVDQIMMRIVDVISTIPLTLYVILIMVLLGSGLQSIIIALGTVYWVDMARVVRGQVLSLREQEFVMAAKTIGSSTWTILSKHLIPNAMGSILVTVTMLIPSAIFMEAFLGFLGIGLRPPLASLGTMCNDATANLRTCPYQLFIPALVIVLIMFAFNFVGDGLRDALDPKLKK